MTSWESLASAIVGLTAWAASIQPATDEKPKGKPKGKDEQQQPETQQQPAQQVGHPNDIVARYSGKDTANAIVRFAHMVDALNDAALLEQISLAMMDDSTAALISGTVARLQEALAERDTFDTAETDAA